MWGLVVIKFLEALIGPWGCFVGLPVAQGEQDMLKLVCLPRNYSLCSPNILLAPREAHALSL